MKISTSLKAFFSRPFFKNKKAITSIYIILCILISLKIYFLETWDNYDCFTASYSHLIHNLDLYLMYPLEYHTEYNYSPTFAFIMGFYAHFPDGIGILLWNLTHTIAFIVAVYLLPMEDKKKNFLLWFCLVEFITAAENVQTNASVAALIMLVFIFQQKEKTTWSSLFYVFGFFFKIYVLTAGVFFLCFNKKGAFVWKALAWGILFFSLPLLFISVDQLTFLYESWIERLQKQSDRHSLSLLGIIDFLLNEGLQQGYIILAGLIPMLLVLIKKEVYKNLHFQILYLGAILMFTIVFNPGVESPSYIIALPGVALWYLFGAKNKWRMYLMIGVFIFTCLSPTEIFPRFIRDEVLVPLHMKAIPVVLTWFICMFDLFSWNRFPKQENAII